MGEAASRAWRGKASVEGGGMDGWTDGRTERRTTRETGKRKEMCLVTDRQQNRMKTYIPVRRKLSDCFPLFSTTFSLDPLYN